MNPYIAIFSVIFVLYGCATTSSQEEVQRTWEAAHVRVFYEDIFVSGKMHAPVNQEKLAKLPQGIKLPTVIYLHGCSGLDWSYNSNTMVPLMKLGFAIIAPDSFARTNRVNTCGQGGKRTTIRYRAAEAKFAAERAKDLPWVDANNLFLIGHSEGGKGAAAYHGDQFNAIAISGASCKNGIASNIPTLIAVSQDDAQLRSPDRICLGAEERVILPGSLHYMLRNKEVADRVIMFFTEYLYKSPQDS